MRILVEEGKHGDRYYDASTPQRLNAAAREIIRQRIDWLIVQPKVVDKSQLEDLIAKMND